MDDAVTKGPVLTYFDEKKYVLSVYASQFSAVLIQYGKSMGFGSVSFSDIQRRYSQIEKELLAVANGCKGFHNHLITIEFIIEKDHKLLIGNVNKPISTLTPWLQCLVMELMRYKL